MCRELFRVRAVCFALTLCVFVVPGIGEANESSAVSSASSTEERTRAFFADTPVMVAIARCESKFRQYTDAGTAFRGGLNNNMVGVFQIYKRIHNTQATSLGYDLTTLDGNLGYAQYLYTRQGTTPWTSSKSCWEDSVEVSTAAADTPATLRERITQLQQRVLALRKQLGEG